MTVDAEQFDAAIVGAGPAGSSAAIQLALNGRRVLLIEEKKFPRPKLCGEFISPECMAHFERLGVSMETRAAPINKTVFYSKRGHSVAVPSDWFTKNTRALGLSRAEMDHRLLQRARDVGVTVIDETHVSDVIEETGRVRGVITRTPTGTNHYYAHITIDATGRHRAMARQFDPPARPKKHKLVAFKAHLVGARPADDACEIYFYPGGYGGLNNIEDGFANLCFIIKASEVRKYNSDPETVMREIVMKNERAAHTLADAHAGSRWISVSLEGFGRKAVSPMPGLLAVGDAASFIDPFTGSGILMALESGRIAADVLGRHDVLETISREYELEYSRTFGSRFTVAGLLRRAAFIPALTEPTIYAFSLNSAWRRRLARATRGSVGARASRPPRADRRALS